MNIERKPVNYGRGGEGHVDLEKAKEANRLKLLKGSDKYQEGEAALEFLETFKKEDLVPGEKRTAEMNVQKQRRDGRENISISKPTKKEIAVQAEGILDIVAEYEDMYENVLKPMLEKYSSMKTETMENRRLKELVASDIVKMKADAIEHIERDLGNMAKSDIAEIVDAKIKLIGVKNLISDIEDPQIRLDKAA